MKNIKFNALKDVLETLTYNENFNIISHDGRVNSILDETNAITFIKNNIQVDNFEIAPARHWYDIAITYQGQWFPINIKITTGDSADNASSKAGMYYALTGIDPSKPNMGVAGYEKFNKALYTHFASTTNTDYYFLVIFKNTGKILFTSLKHVDKLTINPRNLPYQIKWNDNLQPTLRTEEEQSKYIMNTFITAFKQQLKGVEFLDAWQQQYNT